MKQDTLTLGLISQSLRIVGLESISLEGMRSHSPPCAANTRRSRLMKDTAFASLAVAVAVVVPSAHAAHYVDLALPGAVDHAFDPYGILYVTTADRLYRFDPQGCGFLGTRKLGTNLKGVDVSPDGRWIAVAERTVVAGKAHIHLFDTVGGMVDTIGPVPYTVEYPAAFGEAGSWMVAWAGDGTLLISGEYAGSGWVPLRRYDPYGGTFTTFPQVRQETMLSASGDGATIAMAEANSSPNDVESWDVATAHYAAQTELPGFAFEIATDVGGERYVVPGYRGAFVLQRNLATHSLDQVGMIGQYATWGPVGVVFAPLGTQFITAEWGSSPNNGIKLYNAKTLQLQKRIDNYPFAWSGNFALGSGRLTLSADGRWLAANISNGVRLYDLGDEPIDGIGQIPWTPESCANHATSDVAGTADASVRKSMIAERRYDADGWETGTR
jgi:hypothetical protein